MPWNGKEEEIMGTGCNHHEMMVATEKFNPVNITFSLCKVISPMFLDCFRTLRFPKIRKIYTRLQEKRKQQETRTPENSSLPIPFIVHNFTFLVEDIRRRLKVCHTPKESFVESRDPDVHIGEFLLDNHVHISAELRAVYNATYIMAHWGARESWDTG